MVTGENNPMADYVIHYPPSSEKTSGAQVTIREVSELGLPAYVTLDSVRYEDLSPTAKGHIQYAKENGADPVHQLAAIKAAYFLHAMQRIEDFDETVAPISENMLLYMFTDAFAADIQVTF